MKAYLNPIAIAVIVIGLSVFAVARWSDDLVNRTLLGHAESSAATWRTKLVASVPEFELIFEADSVTSAQRELIEASMAGSDIFRFEAFAVDGALTFISDQALFEVEETEAFNETAANVALSGEKIVTVEDGRTSPDRPDQYVEAYLPVVNVDGTVAGVVEVYVDVTGLGSALSRKFNWLSLVLIAITAAIYIIPTMLLIRRNEQLRAIDQEMLRLSKRDPLTGLLNRGAFNEMTGEFFGVDETKHRDPVGLMFIDLDKFKEINDNYGHDVGDQLLKHVAGFLERNSRDNDVLARLGGDEFVILCPNISDEDMALLGDRLMKLARDTPLDCGDTQLYASLSVGTHNSQAGETERRALHCADLALYQAKANGRGQVTAYSADVELKDVRRRAVAQDVQNALGDGRFFLEFQPIFDQARKIAGFEALLRLRSCEGELISPEEFVPIAEEAGQIDEIGRWVLREAIQAASDWPNDAFVNINISTLQFRSGTLVEDLGNIIEKTGIAASRICLELTERVLIEDQDNVTEQILSIKALGAEIAIDDFGTGYSSLSYLWQYEFNKLKIDKSFFEAYSFDPKRYAKIIEMIVELGHQLDMAVVMEGVENQVQLDFLDTTNCDLAQGFHLGRPMPLGETAKLLKTASDASYSPRMTGHA